MITLRVTTDVTDDRRVILTLPPEVPTGRAELVITVESLNGAGSIPSPSKLTLPEWKGTVIGSLS